jgi:hypothetical protein
MQAADELPLGFWFWLPPPDVQIVYTDLKYTVMVKEKGQKVAAPRDILKGINGLINAGMSKARYDQGYIASI